MGAAPRLRWLVFLALLALSALIGWLWLAGWSGQERATIASLSLSRLPAPPPDPSNRFAGDPRAAELGEAIFFDPRFSAFGDISCASCHLPEGQFQDGARPGEGVGRTVRRTMPLAGVAHFPWLFWDGRADSLWAQALGPLENPDEMAGSRLAFARLIASDYAESYRALFGPLPDLSGLPPDASPIGAPATVAAWQAIPEARRDAINRVAANIGKALAAWQHGLTPPRSRFDDYADAIAAGGRGRGILTRAEIAGLRLFIGKGNCTQCHNGPLLSNGSFHNTGVPEAAGLPRDLGRYDGLAVVKADPFNCLGPYSDAAPQECTELRFMAEGEALLGAFKPPSLRGVATRPPYMHGGQFATLAEALNHYNRAPWAVIGVSELSPLNLSARDRANLAAFLGTL
ncbi:cytochrome c peroxidase [Paracoccus halophilus]|uniref:Cytochrome c peroxidase n=1 Tax=Paracoccus halophilus TaxID=376733 RepID=A0A099EY79_9RHOB|nr:cytochrome c peroxidase [Paracoccus halophilus]KGJ03174.1 hypothetical protein IT41_15215 [Paracoccus halophilus]SFA59218.1 cytochrome c peroxidase [Paracoccus halophilus]